MATTRRRFTIDTHAIKTLIGAQAGSLQKAMLEAVANATDAGATQIAVTIDAKKVTIEDDGSGMDQNGIDKHFEVFGFDHTHLGRQIGRFGVGRGQLFCFGRNTWLTTSFRMDIDIEKDGLDYDLTEVKEPRQGTSIAIQLYSPLNALDRNTVETEFKRLVRYSSVPITLNGKAITENPSLRKGWTTETADAWFNLRKNGDLNIYSQGLLVNSQASYLFGGVGGEIITKPGRPLAQNLARNDIMEQNCPVWRRVKAVASAQAAKLRGEAERTGTLTNAMRKATAGTALTPEGANDLMSMPLFTLTNGRHVGLEALLRRRHVGVAPTRSTIADKLMQRGAAQVLDPITLERFGVDDIGDLKTRLVEVLKEALWFPDRVRNGDFAFSKWKAEHCKSLLEDAVFHEDLSSLGAELSEAYEVVPDRQLTPHEKVVLHAMRRLASPLTREISRVVTTESENGKVAPRALVVMESNTMEACTDGKSTIWINRKQLGTTKDLPGFVRLTHLLCHEYIHADNSRGGHQHDTAFYEAFHDLALDSRIADVALVMFGSFVRNGNAPSKVQLSQLIETLDIGTDEVGTGELLAEFNAGLEPVVEEPPSAPVRRRSPGR